MPTETFDLKGLARYLGRDARDLEKLAVQGRLPGHRIAGDWRFHSAEVNHWLELEMPGLSDAQLANFEGAIETRQEVASESFVLRPLMSIETTAVPMEGRTASGVLKTLVQVANSNWLIYDEARVLKAIREREAMEPTVLPGGVAIPHPGRRLTDELGDSVVAFGRTSSGIPFDDRGTKTDLYFLVLCLDVRLHLKCLARIARMIQRPEFLTRLRAANSPQEALDVIEDTELDVA